MEVGTVGELGEVAFHNGQPETKHRQKTLWCLWCLQELKMHSAVLHQNITKRIASHLRINAVIYVWGWGGVGCYCSSSYSVVSGALLVFAHYRPGQNYWHPSVSSTEYRISSEINAHESTWNNQNSWTNEWINQWMMVLLHKKGLIVSPSFKIVKTRELSEIVRNCKIEFRLGYKVTARSWNPCFNSL